MAGEATSATGLLDVGEWQAVIDMRTGLSLERGDMEAGISPATAGRDAEVLSDLLRRMPFPGTSPPLQRPGLRT